MADGSNPFADPLRFQRQAPECAIVIFGASGDLTKRKLMPALYRLAYDSRLPASFSVIWVSRSPLSDQAFQDSMRDAVQNFSEDTAFDQNLWARFAPNLHYVPGDMQDPALYSAIKSKLEEIGQRNVLFY